MNHNLPLILRMFNIFEHFCLRYLCFHFNKYFNAVQLFVFEFLMYHKNKQFLPPGAMSDLFCVNYETTEGIPLLL